MSVRTVSPSETWLEPLEQAARAGFENEAARLESAPPHRYVSRAQTSQDPRAYSFQLAGPVEIAPGTPVCLGEAPQLRGRVVRGYGRMLTVRFDDSAQPHEVRGQGTLRVLPSDRAFSAQREAVAKLRRGEAANPHLAELLAEHRTAEPSTTAKPSVAEEPSTGGEPSTTAEPRSAIMPALPLDADQLDAFRHAVSAPGLLTVLGPPGTGKSTTIAEVIAACVRQGERIVLTAPTHREVDDVLELLPAELDVVRLGGDDAMSARVAARTAPARAHELRQHVLADTAMLHALTEVQHSRPQLETRLAELHGAVEAARSAQHRLAVAGPAIEQALHRATEAMRAQQRQAERDLARHRSILASTEAGLTDAFQSAKSLQDKSEENTRLSFAFRLAAGHQRRRTQRFAQALPGAKAAAEAAEAHQAHLSRDGEAMISHDPAVLRLRAERDQAQADLDRAWPQLTGAAAEIQRLLHVAQAAPDPGDGTIDGWAHFHTACVATLSTLDRRAALLPEWRAAVTEADL